MARWKTVEQQSRAQKRHRDTFSRLEPHSSWIRIYMLYYSPTPISLAEELLFAIKSNALASSKAHTLIDSIAQSSLETCWPVLCVCVRVCREKIFC